MHILQLWVWERFPELRPEMASSPAPDVSGVPRVARWHNIRNVLDTRYVYRVLMSPKEFEWRPYGSSSVALQPKTSGCSWCIEKYRPQRVARQLGFDQDVPGNVVRVNSRWEKAWESYNVEAKVANAVKTKGLYVLVNPVKRKMEGLLAANSCKEMHLDTSIRIHQPASDAAEDLEDEIPLVERLNSTIKKMRKQHTTECSVKVTKMALDKHVQQTEEQNLVIHNVVQGAVSSGSNEAIIGPATEVDMLPSPEDILVISDYCEVETGLNDRTLRQEPDVLAHAAPIQTDVSHSERLTEEMQKCIVAGDKVHKIKIGHLDCNENWNEDVLVSNQELESVIENLAEAHRRKSGNSERSSSRRLVDGITKLVGAEVCTKTLYYLSRFDRIKDAWNKDANSTGAGQGDYMPRRAVGTMEMIKMASAVRKAEIAELKKNIDRLKEYILALEAAEQLEPLKK
ncbi:hypothetical protein BAE44_0024379 [Dichanthelium oligosanthes]|uniref:Aminotransferase-like plant mobile domain-containing protein n=1 Tax=Dichanthelium oligosanthes TaxID=888268 RepID=A0A1E5UNZ6_9POAL|nr:hypothetical protein BAE44_0024379 [Dichanthelium oligosanthes]